MTLSEQGGVTSGERGSSKQSKEGGEKKRSGEQHGGHEAGGGGGGGARYTASSAEEWKTRWLTRGERAGFGRKERREGGRGRWGFAVLCV